MPTDNNSDATLSARDYAEIWEAHLALGLLALPMQMVQGAPVPANKYRAIKWRKMLRDRQFRASVRAEGGTPTETWAQAATFARTLLPQGASGCAWIYGILAETALPDCALMILDIDRPNDPAVAALWARLAVAGLAPSRASVRTGGGMHYYWRVPRGGSDVGVPSAVGNERAYDVRLDGFCVGPGSRVYKKKYGRVIHYEPLVDGQPSTLVDWLAAIPTLDEGAYTQALAAIDPRLAAAKLPRGYAKRVAKASSGDAQHPKTMAYDEEIVVDQDGGVMSLSDLVQEAERNRGDSRKFPCPHCGRGGSNNAHVHWTSAGEAILHCFKSSVTTRIVSPKPKPDSTPLELVQEIPVSALIDGRYLPADLDLRRPVTLMRAHKGAGKSTWCARQLRQLRQRYPGDGPQIVSITLRRVLARQLADDLGIACYLDLARQKAKPTDNDIVVCYDSLAKRCKLHDRGYIVVLDEVAQLLPYIAGGGTNPDRLTGADGSPPASARNWEVFVAMLREAKIVIAMDADLDEETVEMLCQLAPNTFTPAHRHRILVEDPRLIRDAIYSSRPALLYSMWRDVLRGRRIAVACSAVEDAEALAMWLGQLGAYRNVANPWAVRSAGSRFCDPLRVTLATGPLRDLYPDPVSATKDCDVLIYTGTWGTGVDLCQQGHWHRVYGLLDAEVTSAQSASQHLGRIRYPIETTRLLHIKNKGDRPLRDLDKLREAAEKLESGRSKYAEKSTRLLRLVRGRRPPHNAEHKELCVRIASREATGGRLGRLSDVYAELYLATRVEWSLDQRREAASESGFGALASGWKELQRTVIARPWKVCRADRQAEWQAAVAASTETETFELTRSEILARSAVRTRKQIEEILPAVPEAGGLNRLPRQVGHPLVALADVWGSRISHVTNASRAAFALGEVLGADAVGAYLDDVAAFEMAKDDRKPGREASAVARARLVVGLLRFAADRGHFATDHRGNLRMSLGLMRSYLENSPHRLASGVKATAGLLQMTRLFAAHGIQLRMAPKQKDVEIDKKVVLVSASWLPSLPGTPITLNVAQQNPLRQLLAESYYDRTETELTKHRSTK